MNRNERFYILLWSVVIFLLQFAWMLTPASNTLHKMYKYSDQLISKQAYADYFWRTISYIIVFHLFCYAIPSMRRVFTVFFVLWCGFLLDYYLCYNEPFYHLGMLPLSYSLFAGLVMFVTILHDTLRK